MNGDMTSWPGLLFQVWVASWRAERRWFVTGRWTGLWESTWPSGRCWRKEPTSDCRARTWSEGRSGKPFMNVRSVSGSAFVPTVLHQVTTIVFTRLFSHYNKIFFLLLSHIFWFWLDIKLFCFYEGLFSLFKKTKQNNVSHKNVLF